jgi:CubicO group peptidase (beta-lactamase class C family)
MHRFLLLLLLVLPLQAREPDRLADDLDALAKEAHEAWKVPGCAVAVVKDDRVLLLKGYGVREIGKTDAVTPDTRFGIGSLTKAVTATALAKLVDGGKLTWDDHVRKHVPFFHLKDELADRDVTIRDLLCHRSGLARHEMLWYRAPWSLEESVKRMAHLEPDHSFRFTFLYNNLAYITLGFVVTSAAKQPWDEYVRKELFEPLGMNVSFKRSEVLKTADHATPHLNGKPIEWYDDDRQVRASGSIKANVRDLSHWLRFHLDEGAWDGKQLIDAAVLRETYRPQMVTPVAAILAREADTTQASYGLGWRIRDHRGQSVREHGGSVDGFRAHVILAPKQKVGVVVLTNLGHTSMPPALCYALLDRVLELPKKNWNAIWKEQEKRDADAARRREEAWRAKRQTGTKQSRELDAYAGDYVHPAYGKAIIRRAGDGLALEWSSWKESLSHFHYDTFIVEGKDRMADEPITFVLGSDGEVARLRFLGYDFRRQK